MIDHLKFISLENTLDNMVKSGIITQNTMDEKIIDLVDLMYLKLKNYTANLKSTISINVAKNINISNIYTIETYLKKQNIEEIIYLIKSMNLRDLYFISYNHLQNIFIKTKLFYNSIFKSNLINTNNYYYNSTLKKGLKAFFENYNYTYDALNTIITFDYLPFIVPESKGIFFVKEYLEFINYENIFIVRFNLNIDKYKNIPLNIFKIVFKKALIFKYLNLDIYNLDQKVEFSKIYEDYENNTLNLKKSEENLKEDLKLNNNINEYLDRSFIIIEKEILIALKNFKIIKIVYN